MNTRTPVPVLAGLNWDQFHQYSWGPHVNEIYPHLKPVKEWSTRKFVDSTRDHHYVYRYWNDIAPVEHQLLYIGFTAQPTQRDNAHWRTSRQWRRQATRYAVDVYPTRESALHAEWLAIEAEVPIYNSVNTDWERWHEKHGDWMDYVEDRYSEANLAADRSAAQNIEALFRRAS